MKHKIFKIGKLTFIDKSQMTKQEWVGIRTMGVGGSDVSAILDLNPYASITELFFEKIGYKDPVDLTDNENVFWGSMQEDDITEAAQYYDLDNPDRKNYLFNYYRGKKQRNILELNYIVKHQDYPWLQANLDGIQVKDIGVSQSDLDMAIQQLGKLFTPAMVHENKFMTGYTSDKWELGLPIGYVAQVMTYMIPFYHLNPDISSVIWTNKDGNHLEPFPIDFSEKLFQKIVTKCGEFWELVKEGKKILSLRLSVSETENLLTDMAPRPEDVTPVYNEYLSTRLADRKKNTIAGTPEEYELARKFNALNHVKKLLVEMSEVESAMIKESMDLKDARTFEFNEKERVSWSRRLYTETVQSEDLILPLDRDLRTILAKYDLLRNKYKTE